MDSAAANGMANAAKYNSALTTLNFSYPIVNDYLVEMNEVRDEKELQRVVTSPKSRQTAVALGR